MRYAVVVFLFWLTACGQPSVHHSQSYVFGTLVDIHIVGESEARAQDLANHVLQDFQTLHQQLHAWKPVSATQDSVLGQLNTAFAQGQQPVAIDAERARMLTEITALSVQSEGLFNPAIGHLIGLWGFQRDELTALTPDLAKIKNLLHAQPRMTDLVLAQGLVYSTNPTVKLDLGGYAKGYALDQAVAYLRAQKVQHALINIGGNIIALGQNGDRPWRVGIQHPRAPHAMATLDLPSGWAIGTSGDYQRYFMLDGQRYCHIIDPRTGYPVSHTQAVTVLIPPQPSQKVQAGVLSDVASKPIFIAGVASAASMARALGIEYFLRVDAQGAVFATPALAKKLHWTDTYAQFTPLT